MEHIYLLLLYEHCLIYLPDYLHYQRLVFHLNAVCAPLKRFKGCPWNSFYEFENS